MCEWRYHVRRSFCRTPSPELTPEERDARTVFCMQLAARIRPRDLEEFFSAVGKVCNATVLPVVFLGTNSEPIFCT
jgi:hypothetical protein